MDTNKIVKNQDVEIALSSLGLVDYSADEGRLMLLELIAKAGAGFYNSHTEEAFMNSFGLLKKDRMPNKRGMIFISSMVYASSCKKPACFNIMRDHRR